ncbi:hypothetical protein Ahy_A09g045311 [Arachis hypogaea]|uniref:CCHC-type domain-containing protein n=1 Tax=Arachis hypogaea TaxID=3818 RepID=A0A445BM46_ARAHY|nr:hypothetical protein Ahy_A09g045311 [Arachis hypogaea]
MEGTENAAMEGDVLDLEKSLTQHGEKTDQKLVGRVLTGKVLNTITVHKTILNMWGDPQGLVITNAGPNSFILNFKSQEEARRAYEGGPWRIEGHMLSLQWWSSNLSIDEVNYNQLSIWVQIYGLPYDKINTKNSEKIGAILRRVISAEDPFVEGNMLRSFLRVRVEINVQVPLKTGFWFRRSDRSQSWAEFKYEKLYDYCYKCGRIGHDKRACGEELVRSLVNPEIPRYGPELTTPGLRSIKNEARKAGIRRRKEEQNNWVEELWEARERSLQGREWLKRQAHKDRRGSSLGGVRSSQASASAKSWDREENPQEQMGERQVAIQEVQDQGEVAEDDKMNGEEHNSIFMLNDDGTANHKKGKKEEVIQQRQQASELAIMRNVNEAKDKDKAEENEEDNSEIPRKHKEKGGPSMRRMDSTNRGTWAFMNQRPNRNRQQIRSGPIEGEGNLTIREILMEFNKNMAEENRKRSTGKEVEDEAQNRNNMDIDGPTRHYRTNEEQSKQRGKQIITESEGGFYYVELAEEEEEIEQKNSKAILVAREYETELIQRMEEKLKFKRRREEDQQERTATFQKEEEEGTQMSRANKKNRRRRSITEGGAHEEGSQIRDNLKDITAEEAGLHMPPTQP